MERSTLLELVTMAGEQAKKVMIGLQQPLIPSWVYMDQKNNLHVIGTPWADDEEKELAARMVRHRLRKDNAIAYSLVTEAWSALQPKGWTDDQPIEVMPRNRPDRKEVVLAFATDGQHVEWKSWATKRDWTERVIALEEQPFDMGSAESWLTQLLKK